MGFPGGTDGTEPACQCWRHMRHSFNSWVRKIPWRRAWQPTPVFLPRESHGQWILVGYSPQRHRVGHDGSDLACTHKHWRLMSIDRLLCAREMTYSKCQYREAPFFNPFYRLENHGTEKLRNALKAHRQVQLGLESKPALQQMASPPGRVSSKQRGPV